MNGEKVLKRSHDSILAGVCGGIAEYIGWQATNFRILFVLISFLSAAFPGLLVYIVLWVTMPPPDGSSTHL